MNTEDDACYGFKEGGLAPYLTEDGVCRIAFKVGSIDFSPKLFQFCLSLLNAGEREKVISKYKLCDRKLALGSMLLQRALVRSVFGLRNESVNILRSSEGPFCFL